MIPANFPFRATGRPLRTGKCTVEFGLLHGREAVLKRLRVREPFWIHRFRQEVAWYERFARLHPPVPTPELLSADKRRCAFVTTRARGIPLSRQRYVSEPVPPTHVSTLLGHLQKLHRWRPYPVPGVEAVRQDFLGRFTKYVDGGSLAIEAPFAAHVVEWIKATEWQPEFNHGDLLLSNVLVHRGQCTLIDWEFAGWFLPGYDLAMLWLLLARDPASRQRVAVQVDARPVLYRHGFLLNRLLLIGRETRIHKALSESEARSIALQQLHTDLEASVKEVATLYRFSQNTERVY